MFGLCSSCLCTIRLYKVDVIISTWIILSILFTINLFTFFINASFLLEQLMIQFTTFLAV